MALSLHATASVLVLLATSTACTQRLPPPEAPATTAPVVALPTDAPAAGHGRLVLDAADGPAVAALVLGRGRAETTVVGAAIGGGMFVGGAVVSSRMTRRLCTTPCVVDLPRGDHEIVLSLPGTDRVASVVATVRSNVGGVRVALGRERPSNAAYRGGLLAIAFGGLFASSGGLILLNDDARNDVGDHPAAYGAYMGLSSALIGLGIWLVLDNRPVSQPSSLSTLTF